MKKSLLRVALFVLCFLAGFSASAQTPVPIVLGTNPAFAVVTSNGFTLGVTGNNFDNTAVVNWNGSARATTYLSSSQLTATILQSDIATMGSVSITVTTDGGTSNGVGFQILGPLAVVNSWTPKNFTVGAGATITIFGQNFLPGCIALFNWTPLTTSYISSTQLNAVVGGGTVTTSGPANIVVTNPLFPAAPALSLSPANFAFGTVVVGTTPSPVTSTVTNVGNLTLTISSIAAAGSSDFSISGNTCGSTLASHATCTVSVSFTPTAAVGRSGFVLFTDSAGNSPQAAATSGQGYILAPVVSLAFTTHNYGSVLDGNTSGAITEVVTNTGNANLVFSLTPAISGPNAADFTIGTETCTTGTPVTSGSSCSTSITFSPSTGGAETASLSYADNASGSPQVVTLQGTGIALAPIISLSPNSLAFGSEPDGSTTSALVETVTNAGNANLTFSITPALSGTNAADFTISAHTCASGTPITPSSNCTTSITFTPSISGAETATLTYTDNASGSPHTVALTGTGVALSPAVSLSPPSLAFGNIVSGSSSSPTVVTLTNSGGASLTISSIALGGTNPSDFSKTTTCGGTLAALANCTVSVTFSPASVASFSASLTFTDSASGSPQSVPLTGTGISSGTPTFSDSPGTLAFGSVTQGTTSSALTETVTNTGTANLMFSSSPSLSGTNAADFAISTETCVTGTPVAASGTCHTSITFTPSTTGSESATLTYQDNASGSPHTASLTGTGSAPASHYVVITWTASVSTSVLGYNVYRGTLSGGPYGTKLTPTPINAVTYTDNTVSNATTYYYAITTVGSNPPYVVTESADSTQTTAVVP